MLDVIRPTSCGISDLNLASYLMLRGAKLEGVTVIQKNRASFMFTHKRMSDLIHDYNQHRRIKFSPRALFEFRESLKRLSAFDPNGKHIGDGA